MTRPLVLASLLLLGACVTGRKVPDDLRGSIATQVSVAAMAACISQATSVVPVEVAGYVVLDAAANPARRYTIRRVERETVVLIQGAPETTRPTIDPAVRCAASLAPTLVAR